MSGGYDPTLGGYFSFSEEDLLFNRDGHLSAEQQASVHGTVRMGARAARRGKVWGLVIGIAVVGMIGWQALQQGASPIYAVFLVPLALMLVPLFLIRRRGMTRDASLAGSPVTRAEGKPTLERDEWSEGGTWIGRIGEARFPADHDLLDVLDPDVAYRLYYLRYGRDAWVLSLERA